ncbi:Transmembrane 9 superfamily member 2 [Hibiscus syriacus]|uniref:Transmembrane 9 superfamily member n=1 Tax=Hibiscus syriacus TaxID=106335 RepID=A0A6A3B065_HIBSY|nr:Transmembrane 9 superfamily member 2 [Hibiscus syriacus]
MKTIGANCPAVLILGVLVLSCLSQVRSDASDHRYKEGDPVPLYANKVGPFHNPVKPIATLICPFVLQEKKEALGEVLNGDRLAVGKDYYFQMYYDDLPIWGFIGKVDKEGKADPSEYKYYLYKHIQFDVLYNKDRVIEISARMDPHSLVDLTEDKEVDAEFMYTVKWKETDTPFEKRMEKYSMSSSLPHHLEIHWFSIINSCVTVLLLTGFLATILMRVLKNDFIKYDQDEEAADDQEETGWKYIHGDVFRFPKYKSLFAAALGSGAQLFTFKAEFQAPCRTTKYPREIPPLPWYRSAIPQMAMAGFLPFSAIYIELYYILPVSGATGSIPYTASCYCLHNPSDCHSFITVALTYFQLAAEDHEWSFLCGGSTGIFIYAYCLYYYYARSDMSGFMQTSFFFGYMACIYGFFLMLGQWVSVPRSSSFVTYTGPSSASSGFRYRLPFSNQLS